ncbi:hypothetical protein J3Q64DRAFT_1866415 [Phycomyces blakesleeanus]|uniref:F-box domain-containing protein n=2 Tax=Phycomyces blakesleeanus TaxID=4837 RepID=A0A167JSM7_PHYB8|nr:hypothetical protein PHYBLDRAFT_71951 [Phycomyces blakesleeanus NRRL 1555(-)]OAD66620.1 hypothetical protein PHYBLDRAFT_71951 [Phycomyces blakesleeanus NRRL 1555(-)]|eukprot:XP_018284660.1 hypothetical protein PHYBLDRAFT_71951 [Phycomyces blakesleeanus NRRL 1555(-)]
MTSFYIKGLECLDIKMAEKLSPNLISYIATFIPKADQISCSIVCKKWTQPLLNVIWSKIILSQRDIDNICNKYGQANNYWKNSHRVWALTLTNLPSNRAIFLPILQQMFRRLSYLEYTEVYQDKRWIVDSLNWNLWNSLTYLNVTLEYVDKSLVLMEMFEKLSVLRRLSNITIEDARNTAKNTTVSWLDIESLHQYLPRLKYLKVGLILTPITDADVELLHCIPPAYTLTRAEYSTRYMDDIWVLYLSLKYPSLQTLRLAPYYTDCTTPTTTESIRLYEKEKPISSIHTFLTLNKFFPNLTRADLCWKSPNGWKSSVFYDVFSKFGTSLVHLNVYLHESLDIQLLNSTIDKSRISKGLKIMTLFVYKSSFSKCGNLAFTISLYPYLAELNINAIHTPIEINNILVHCPVLQKLGIENSSVYLDNLSTHTYPHCLKKLNLAHLEVSTQVLNYISICCRGLKTLKMSFLKFSDSSFEENGQLLVDMPFTQLDTLTVREILFDKHPIHHFAIEQLKGLTSSLTTNHKELTQHISMGEELKFSWYHLCQDKTNRKLRSIAWGLSRRDIEFAKRYYRDFGRRRRREKKRKDMRRSNGLVLRRFWKRDLQYGMILFRFRFIKDYYITP